MPWSCLSIPATRLADYLIQGRGCECSVSLYVGKGVEAMPKVSAATRRGRPESKKRCQVSWSETIGYGVGEKVTMVFLFSLLVLCC